MRRWVTYWHLWGVSPVCCRTWFTRWSFLVKAFGQYWHRNGVSPVCWRTWLIRCSFRVKDLEQYPQRCGDSPVCWRTWFNRCSLRVNAFEQKSHRWGVSPDTHKGIFKNRHSKGFWLATNHTLPTSWDRKAGRHRLAKPAKHWACQKANK